MDDGWLPPESKWVNTVVEERHELDRWYSRLPKGSVSLGLVDDLMMMMCDKGMPSFKAREVACKWVKERVETYFYETVLHPLDIERGKEQLERNVHESAVHAIASEIAPRMDIVLTDHKEPRKVYEDIDDMRFVPLERPQKATVEPKGEDPSLPPHFHRRRFQMFFLKFPKK